MKLNRNRVVQDSPSTVGNFQLVKDFLYILINGNHTHCVLTSQTVISVFCFDIFTAGKMKIQVFWGMMPC